jgi:hypothetical protein
METKVTTIVEIGIGAPCGLYCSDCPTERNGSGPHPCCTQKHCPSHTDSDACEIYQCCVVKRALDDCSTCTEFPCSMLLEFSHSSKHPERIPAIVNLQRRKSLGIRLWLAEERTFWQQPEREEQWKAMRKMLRERRHYYDEMRLRILALTAEVELATSCGKAIAGPPRVPSHV